MVRKIAALWVMLLSTAIVLLASGMTPASAAVPVKKSASPNVVRKSGHAKRLANTAGGGSGMLSLEWMVSAVLQP